MGASHKDQKGAPHEIIWGGKCAGRNFTMGPGGERVFQVLVEELKERFQQPSARYALIAAEKKGMRRNNVSERTD